MPTYAVLGANGATGSQICKRLLASRSDVRLHVFARSASKVSSAVPELAGASNATTFFGSLSDTGQLVRCLDGAAVVFSTVAQNANEPGCSIGLRTAIAVVASLEMLRRQAAQAGNDWSPPRVVFLTSASLNRAVTGDAPGLLRRFVHYANFYVYEDLRRSIAYLEAEAPWLPVTYAAPGGLVKAEPQGFEMGTHLYSPALAYSDLAGAMIAMAEQEGWEHKYVGVRSLGRARGDLLLRNFFTFILPGALISWFPSTFRLFNWLGFFRG